MRALLTAVACVLAVAGCAGGPEANRAHELLLQAQAAEAKLTSAEYTATTKFAAEGQSFSFDLEGAVVLAGASAGDQWLRMTSGPVPGSAPIEMSMARRGDRMTISSMGRTQELPVPAELARQNHAWASFASGELATCVEKVDVEEGRNLNGEPATRIAGVIDAKCAVEQMSSVSSLGQSQSAPALDPDALGADLGVARATLFVSDRTHLLIGGVISMEMDVDGRNFRFDVSYRLKSVNRPVRFPG